MRCLICRVKDAMPTSEVCEEMDCIKKYLASGRGSVSGTPYKEYIRHCAKVVEEQGKETN